MSNICIIGHISIDMITNKQIKEKSIGGPPCYTGITCINEGLNVEIYTKVGKDFPIEYKTWLENKGIIMKNSISVSNTTSFEITEYNNNNKKIKLLNKCENIILEESEINNYEGIIISPIVNELNVKNKKILNAFGKKTMLDPQGYLRKFNEEGICNLRYMNINELPQTEIIKISEEESLMLDKSSNFLDRLKNISKIYPITIGTINNQLTYLINDGKCYAIKNNQSSILKDTIGLGDILNGVFFSMYMKNNDILWSISRAIAFTSTREGIGIKKLESNNEYDELSNLIYDNIMRIY